MGLRGLGQHSKTAAIYLITGISGGTVLLNVYYSVAKLKGYQFAMCVPTITFGICLAFPLYCYLSPVQKERFEFYVRGDTVGALDDVSSMARDFCCYVGKCLDTGEFEQPSPEANREPGV